MKKMIMVQFLWAICAYVSGQSLTIVYEAYSFSAPENVLKAMPTLSGNSVKYYYSLTIDKGVSIFSRDSLFAASFSSEMKEVWFFEDIYKIYNEDKWIKHSGRYKDGYAWERKISKLAESNDFKWKISQERKNIAGIECVKATSYKGYTVWFAPKLPYPDGPRYGIYNLPGLVLSLETAFDKWVAKTILVHNKKIQMPKFEFVQDEKSISLSFDEIKNLSTEKAIVLDKNAPSNRWFTFKKL
jgi:GLPGLI family protein